MAARFQGSAKRIQDAARIRAAAGLTLIEIIMALAILGIVAAIKSPLKKVGVVAIVAAVAVLVVSLTTIMWSRLG